MKILVAIRQVPSRDSQLSVREDGVWVEEEDLSYEINEPDAYALEEALQLKEKQGGEVVVLCLGPESASEVILEALAKGADRAVHIEEEIASSLDSFSVAQILAKSIQEESPDLVLTGLQSDDMGSGQTGVIIAELIGYPHATIIMQTEVQSSSVRVKRELEDGWFQHVTMPLPALLTIQSGINTLRYANLMGIRKAKTKEVRQVSCDVSTLEEGTKTVRVYLPHRQKQTTMLEGDPAAIASQLVEKLKTEARVL